MEIMTNSEPCHLCLTHSPLVTMVFQTAMTHLDIPEGCIRSISRRGVRPAGQGISLDELSDDLELRFKGFQRTGYRRTLQKIRNLVDDLIEGRKFIVYLPHLNRILYQEIIAHPACAGYLFVEEGFTSMNWKSTKSSIGKRLKNRLRSLWSGSAFRGNRAMYDTVHPKFQGALAISESAFQGMKKVLNVAPWIPAYPSSEEPGTLYVILDTSYLHRGIRWESYQSALVKALRNEASSGRNIAIKFHFADVESKAHFRSIRNEIGAAELLARDFSVEDHFCAGDLLFFAVTSLGYYVAKFGGKVKCFALTIEGLDLEKWVAEGLLPADFSATVGLNKE